VHLASPFLPWPAVYPPATTETVARKRKLAS
jgi:hypothetical protein